MYILFIAAISALCAFVYHMHHDYPSSILRGFKYVDHLRAGSKILIVVLFCLGLPLCKFRVMRMDFFPWYVQFVLSLFIFFIVFSFFVNKVFFKKISNEQPGQKT